MWHQVLTLMYLCLLLVGGQHIMPEDIFGAVRGVMKRCRGAYGVVVRHITSHMLYM